MFSSIKSKLIAWYLLAFLILITGLGSFLYYELEDIVVGSIDSHLHSEVQLIAGLLEEEDGELEVDLSEASAGDYSIPLSGHYFQIISSAGRVIARSPSLSIVDASLPIENESFNPSYKTILWSDKRPIRLLVQSFRLPGGTSFTIQASESMEDAIKLLRSFRNIILFIFPCAFLLSGLGIWLMAKYSLRKLNTFSQQIGQITEKNLSERVDEIELDREIKPLAISFNAMLGRMERAFAMQKEFLSDASHILRTPIAIVKSNCEVTLGKSRNETEYRKTLTSILEATNRISLTINRIMEASRLESDVFSLKLTKIDLMEIMIDVVKAIKPFAERHEITVTLHGQKTIIEGDRERLLEAFTNIVENGVKYNKSGGSIKIDVIKKNNESVVAIADTGVGISEKEKNNIFNRFYRIKERSDEECGYGIGLSIAHSIISSCKGNIEVDSKKGEGSCFRISFTKNI